MLKHFTIILVLYTSISVTVAEASSFNRWNLDMLGFSSDSNTFVIVESITETSDRARATIRVTDVATNQCVERGCLFVSDSEDQFRTERQVLKEVYKQTWKLRNRLKLTPPRGGYRAKGPFFDEDDCQSAHYWYDNQKITVRMQQQNSWPQQSAVQLKVTIGELQKNVDSLSNYRKGARKYQLGSLFISPNNRSLAILVYVIYNTVDGQEVRTLAQTATFF